MTKKEFTKLIEKNSDIFGGVILRDFTIRRDYLHCAIFIYWKGTTDKTVVKVLRCGELDERALKELAKYKRWANIL